MNRFNTLRATALASAVAVSAFANVAAAPSGNTNQAPSSIEAQELRLDREGLSTVILEVWETQVAPLQREQWRDRMSERLAQSDLHNLRRAADALDYDQMLAALSGALPASASAEQPQSIGDIDRDLSFTPVEPCRIVDTRLAGGKIGADSQRGFIGSTATDFTVQGGSDGDCNIPQGAAALSVNLTVVAPDLAGYAVAFPFGVEAPLAASVNYTANSIVGNEVVVPLAQDLASDFSVYTFRSAHVVVDVTGYYMRPQATMLDCTFVEELRPLASGDEFQGFISCPTGYAATGGACSANANLAAARDLIVTASEPGVFNPEDWFCAVLNDGAVNRSFRHMARCCRVPGR